MSTSIDTTSAPSNFSMSEKVDLLFGALAKAQAEMNPAKKSGFNPHFKSHFSNYEDIKVESSKAHKHGLSISHHPVGYDSVRTILGHSSGQYIMSIQSMKPTKNDPQGTGSSLTYMVRYAERSVFGIATEDDDGNAASAKVGPAEKPKSKYTEQQKNSILTYLKKSKKEFDTFPKTGWSEKDWERAALIANKIRAEENKQK